ncbi:MAG: tRNA 2-thiouridine(34) synthase MnmA [Bacillales bacterium]
MRVMLGLSGGVDSAVCAYLLKKQGHDVICCFMRNWDSITNNDILGNPNLDNGICSQEKDYNDALAVANKLNLPLLRADFIDEYWNNVFTYFLDEYKRGRTPNPDIFCNKYIKFGPFIDFAKQHKCDKIAMGHYCLKKIIDNKSHLYKAKDLNKDQTYFLSQISQEQLDFCLFPLGDLTKEEVRAIAKELNLDSVMNKKDSTGVCFIGERRFKEFLKNYIPSQSGNIVDINTKKIIGRHDGVLFYTLGQRKGLGIGGISGIDSNGWYVCDKDVKNNILYVANNKEDEHLLSKGAIITNVNLFNEKIIDGTEISVKFRYRQQDKKVILYNKGEEVVELIFNEKYNSVTPGQACVFYKNDECLGGGIIDKVIK